VAALVAAARSTSGDASSQAAVALVLARLALPPHTEAVAAGGATPVLIDALRLPAGGAELTLAAAAALQQLVRTAKGRAEILAGGIGPCLKVLAHPEEGEASEATLLHTLAVLQHLVLESNGSLAVGGSNAAYPLG